MKRKCLIKRLMALGIPRNEAVVYANGCSGEFSHIQMLLCVVLVDEFRSVVRAAMPEILHGKSLKVQLEAGSPHMTATIG